jgi:plastocyanin
MHELPATGQHRRRRMPVPALALIVILALATAACTGDEGASPVTGTDQPDPAGGQGHQVSIDTLAFDTDRLEILVGEEVSWTNNDEVIHTVTHGRDGMPIPDGLFDQSIQPGERFTFPFDIAGTYPVTCSVHPDMNMEVVVQDAEGGGGNGGAQPTGEDAAGD